MTAEDLQDNLKTKLLSNGGNNVKFGLDSQYEIERMLIAGQIYNCKVFKKEMFANQCHRNISELYNKNKKKGFKIITGYSLYGKFLVQHTFGLQNNQIIETVPINYICYFGYELTIEESSEFLFYNL